MEIVGRRGEGPEGTVGSEPGSSDVRELGVTKLWAEVPSDQSLGQEEEGDRCSE